MDALTLLKQDHQTVEELFKRFESSSARALKQKRQIADKFIRELAIHAMIEEQVLYPTVRAKDEKLNDEVMEALEEHHIVKWTLSELEKMKPEDERFIAKVTVLIESVRHHVKEEERELFPAVRKAFSREELQEMGGALEKAKKLSPTHPHPRAPDEPPGNLIAGAFAKVVDTGRDLLQGRKTRQQAAAKRRRQPAKG